VLSLANRTIRTIKNRDMFLEALASTANVTEACEITGVGRSAAYDWRREDDEFRAAWDASLDVGVGVLEDEAVRRAVKGVDKPVYQGGQMVGTVREYSDTLLIFLLKGRKREMYGDRTQLNHSGTLTLESLVRGSYEPPQIEAPKTIEGKVEEDE